MGIQIHELTALNRAPQTGDVLAVDTGTTTNKVDYSALRGAVLTDAVRTDDDQNLTDAQKAQAIENIGAATQADVTAIEDEIGNTALPTTAQTITGAVAEHETDISDVKTTLSGTVKFNVDQSIGSANKARARNNIGAASSDAVETIQNTVNHCVKFSSQTLTDSQKAQARTNIGAASEADTDALETLVGNTTLPTTAQTVTGAIAEQETDISNINSAIGTVHPGSNLQGEVDDLKSATKHTGSIANGIFANGAVIFTNDDIPVNTEFEYDFTTSDSGVQYIRFLITGGSYIQNIGKTSGGGVETFTGKAITPFNYVRCEAYCSPDTTLGINYIAVNPYDSVFSKKTVTENALKNLYNGIETVLFNVYHNKGFNASTGAIPNENYWTVSDYIPVVPGETLTISNTEQSTRYNGFYASDKSFISSFTVAVGNAIKIDVPNNAYYMVLSNSTSKFAFVVTRDIKNLVTKSDVISVSRNLLNQPFVRGRINVNTGEAILGDDVGSFVTEKIIPVTPETEYTFSHDKAEVVTNTYIYGFESDGDIYGRLDNIIQYRKFLQNITILIPSGIYGIKIQIGDATDTYTDNIRTHTQFEEGGVQTPYVEPNCVKPTATDGYSVYKSLSGNDLFPDLFTLPNYYFENNYLPAKCETINSYLDSSVANGDAFVFITDEHWEENAQRSPAMLRYIFDKTTVNKLISGGDIYDGNHSYDFPTAREFMLKLRHGFPGKIWPCVGNHDLFKDMPSSRLSALFDMYHDDYNGNPDKHYYYVDNKRAKIRYIVLADYYSGGGDNVLNGFTADTEQQTWFRDVALNLSTGWGAVIITHQCWYNGATMADLVFDSRFKVPLIDVVNNYSGNGEIICIIQGHTHVDRILHTGDNGTGVPVIITTCDKYKPVENPADIYPANREIGTIREQAFDVIIINRTIRTIYAVRCGCEAYDGTTDDAYGNAVQVRTVEY